MAIARYPALYKLYFIIIIIIICGEKWAPGCLLYTSPSPRDGLLSRMPSSA